MKLAKWGAVASLSLIFAVSAQAKTEKRMIDTSASTLEWSGSKIVGDKHVGTLKFKSGHVNWKGSKPGSGVLEVDMTTITNTDLTSAKYNKKLVGHLKSDEFFGVNKFPTATLKIKNIKLVKGRVYLVIADLKIKNKTKEISFNADLKGDTVTANIEFDRTDFDVRYGSGKFFDNLGDKMISDKVQLKAKLKMKKADKKKVTDNR